jgi:hypothetical protein
MDLPEGSKEVVTGSRQSAATTPRSWFSRAHVYTDVEYSSVDKRTSAL